MTSRNTVLDPKAKNGKRYLKWKELTPPVDEPREGKNSFEIHWFKGNESCDRLGSPLIVKAMPLVNGNYYPLALWLYRSYPQGGTVGLKSGDPRSNRSKAEFDLLVAAGDKALFTPLDIGNKEPQGLRMRTAFMHWLETKKGAKPMS
jgi:CRISPR-associated protein Cmr1